MNLGRKVEIAKKAIASITRHDDESQEVMEATVDILRNYIDEELAAAAKRRSAEVEKGDK